MNKTKIIATLWPSLDNEKKIIAAYKAGLNIVRFNFSHAEYKPTLKIKHMIDELNEKGKTKISFMLDTKWPEIRIWDIDGVVRYKKWDVFKIYIKKEDISEPSSIRCDYPYILQDLKVGKKITIDSWIFKVKIIKKHTNALEVKALNSGEVKSRRHVNLPWVKLRFDSLSQKDIDDISFAAKNNFHFIAASFIRNKSNVIEIRQLLDSQGGKNIKIISKIENQEWIDNLDEIIYESDGIMVARGDLWIEVPIEKLWKYQKEMIHKCKELGKFVIVATHFLESMIELPFPTRAETSDVFHTVLEQPDCIMLSGETAVWKFPIQSIKMMSKVTREAEKTLVYKHKDFSDMWLRERDVEKKHMIKSGIYLWEELKAKALIVFTKTGKLARLASAYRPKLPVYAFTKFESTEKYTNILYWITPLFLPNWVQENYHKNLEFALKILTEKKFISSNDKIIVVNDIQKDDIEIPVLEVINMKDLKETLKSKKWGIFS